MTQAAHSHPEPAERNRPHPVFFVGTSLDIGATQDCLEQLRLALEALSLAHLSGSLAATSQQAAAVKRYADRISHICGALSERLSDQMNRRAI